MLMCFYGLRCANDADVLLPLERDHDKQLEHVVLDHEHALPECRAAALTTAWQTQFMQKRHACTDAVQRFCCNMCASIHET